MLAVIFSFSKRGGLLNAAIGRFLAGIGCEAECCTYSVVATVAGVATVGVTSINNATLGAIVVDNATGC